MAILKSQDIFEIYSSLLRDIEVREDLDLTRDVETIASRYAFEGLSFVTRILPAFYKSVLHGLEVGQLQPVQGFKKKSSRKGPLPAFLHGLVSQLFDADGKILNSGLNEDCLGHIAQICTLWFKCEMPYTEEQEAARLRSFVETENLLPEHELPRFDARRSNRLDELTLENAIFAALDLLKRFSVNEQRPRHGPGAVSVGEKGWEKYDFRYCDRLDKEFPYETWFHPQYIGEGEMDQVFDFEFRKTREGERLYNDVPQELRDTRDQRFDSLCSPFVARGIFVNKDARGPRYISAEPKEFMWIQQLVARALVECVRRSPFADHMAFRNQGINASLALEASKTKRYATLDMEDASDRLSMALVRHVLPSNITRKLEACRSQLAMLPNGDIVRLRKFAPMGSAVCFPVETIMFFVLTAGCIQAYRGGSFAKAAQDVFVYGDDIIVNCEDAAIVMETLEHFALKFNKAKCFIHGSFRESCGMDAFNGVQVTPVKIRRPPPIGRQDASGLISWTATSNLLHMHGYWRCAAEVRRIIERALGDTLPVAPPEWGFLSLFSFANQVKWEPKKIRYNPDLQQLEQRSLRIVKRPVKIEPHVGSETQRKAADSFLVLENPPPLVMLPSGREVPEKPPDKWPRVSTLEALACSPAVESGGVRRRVLPTECVGDRGALLLEQTKVKDLCLRVQYMPL